MSENVVTGEGLTDKERDLMLATKAGHYVALQEAQGVYKDLLQKGLLVYTPASQTLTPGKAFTLTEAGRALLPKAGADVPPERLAQDYVNARQKAWDMGAAFVDYKTWLEQRLAGVEVQCDDANERAAAAEAEMARLRDGLKMLRLAVMGQDTLGEDIASTRLFYAMEHTDKFFKDSK